MTSSNQGQFKLKWSKPFPVIGKGTFLFNVALSEPFRIIVRDVLPDEQIDTSFIELNVGNDEANFNLRFNCQCLKYPAKKNHDFFDNIGIEKDLFCTYWLSYDSDRMIVKYGKGYRTEKTTILEANLCLQDEILRKALKNAFFDPKVQRNVELYAQCGTNNLNSMMDVEPFVDFDHMPFLNDRLPLVKDSSTANMFDLDEGGFTYSASLPKECLELYTNVTAKNVDLVFMKDKCPNFNLVDAIRYSIQTPGALLYKILKSKKEEFDDKNPKEAYLRITLGDEYGNSPGVPYVLEIWPSHHGSPIHNHGNAYAVIRVLHGGLTVKIYNKTLQRQIQSIETCDEKGLLSKFHVNKNDVTWISPYWFQTHKLWNHTDDFCATIQCYQYGQNDNTHWPYFDYVASCDYMEEFEPNSDLTFTEMVNKLKEEYPTKPKSSICTLL